MRHAQRLNGKFILESFEKEGYKPLFKAEDYKNNLQKLPYICPAGHRYSISWGSWSVGCRCRYCGHIKRAIKARTPESEFKEIIKKEGYKLIDYDYKGGLKIKWQCHNGHIIYQPWDNFRKGIRCRLCGYTKVAEKLKKPYEFIKQAFEKEGYKLLTPEYINNHQNLDYICPKGHKSTISWSEFQHGNRCRYCWQNYSWHDSFDFRSSDAVRILTFLTYQGTFSRSGFRFTGKYLDYLYSLLIKYFPCVKRYSFSELIRGKKANKEYLSFSSELFAKACRLEGWGLSRRIKNTVPEYVFNNINLFKVFLASLIDTGGLHFSKMDYTDSLRFSTGIPSEDAGRELNSYLLHYGLPMAKLWSRYDKKFKRYHHYIFWSKKAIYKLLDFINWDLHRPWHIGVMDRLKKIRECKNSGKWQFM